MSKEAEAYELINHYEAYDTVLDVVETYWNQHRVILDIDKAAKEVENYLEANLEKGASTKKFKSKFSSTPPETQNEERQPNRYSETRQNTGLTNRDAAGTAQVRHVERYLSDDESKAAAAEFIRQARLAKAQKG